MVDVLEVWLDGRFAGKLMRGQTEQVEFLYDEEYLRNPRATALSASIPKSLTGHGPETVMPWLSNLLPDAFQAAIDEVPIDMLTPELRAMPSRIQNFAVEIAGRTRPEDLSYRALPRFQGLAAIGRPLTNRVWQPGEWRGSRWVTGRYRDRAAR